MNQKILDGLLLDEQTELTIIDLCFACSSSEDWIVELVEEGAIEPVNLQTIGKQYTQWIFTPDSLQKVRTAKRLQRDLNVNLAGIALALNLLEQIERLEAKLSSYEITTK